MTISNLIEQEFVNILNEHLRPSRPIESFEHLHGRDKQLDQIKQAIYSPGRHIFIYGDRGVGKTSLARTAAFKFGSSANEPPYVACGLDASFVSVADDIVTQLRAQSNIVPSQDITKTSIGVKGFGIERSVQRSVAGKPEIRDLNSAVESIRSLCPQDGNRLVVVIDEFDRLVRKEDQSRFAEFIKQLGDRTANVAFVFCGIGKSLDDLLHAHASCYRYLEGIELQRLSFGGRWEIIDRSSEALKLKINDDSRFRIAAISDGYPHYVHLVCEKLYWSAFEAAKPRTLLTPQHYMDAVRAACASIESHLRQAYDKATKKDNDVYEEVLWALADHFELTRNVDAIYKSYQRIMEIRKKAPLDRKQFISRLNNLKGERHGSILQSRRRSWYEFSENMVRGYVRLRAEEQDVPLALEHEPSAEPKKLTVGPVRSRPTSVIDRPRFGGDPLRDLERKDK